MGFFDSVVGAVGAVLSSKGDSSAENDDGTSTEPLETCTSCGNEVPESDIDENGECIPCAEYDGTAYCCGIMYDAKVDDCWSCGEPLRG